NTPAATPTLELEVRDANTGTILNSLPPPSSFAGTFGSVLVPQRGVVSYSYNYSWLVSPTEATKVLGIDLLQHMAVGNFGILGHRALEATVPFYLRVLGQDGPIPTPTGSNQVVATYENRVSTDHILVQDLDGDGSD